MTCANLPHENQLAFTLTSLTKHCPAWVITPHFAGLFIGQKIIINLNWLARTSFPSELRRVDADKRPGSNAVFSAPLFAFANLFWGSHFSAFRTLHPKREPLNIGEEYWTMRDSVVQTELLIMRMLQFQVNFNHPHKVRHLWLIVLSLKPRGGGGL